MARIMIVVLLAAFVAVAAGEIGSCTLNFGSSSQGSAEKHCYQCQWDCLTNFGCTSMLFDGRTVGRASLITYDCGDGHWTGATGSPGICVLIKDDTVIDTQEQGCEECTHQCKYWGDCDGIYYNYAFAAKADLDGFCGSPAPIVPNPSPGGFVPTPIPNSPLPICGGSESQFGGRQGEYLYDIVIGAGAWFEFYYNAYDIPDRFTVELPDGTVLFDTLAGTSCGPFGGQECLAPGCGVEAPADTVRISKPFDVTDVLLRVNAPCIATGYDWSISCAEEPIVNPPSPVVPAPVSSPPAVPLPPIDPSPIPGCGSGASQFGGTQGEYLYDIVVGPGNSVEFTYNAYDIPDRFTVELPDGTVLFDTLAGTSCGPFGGQACLAAGCGVEAPADTVTITKPFDVTDLLLRVNAPCIATGYDWSLSCAQ